MATHTKVAKPGSPDRMKAALNARASNMKLREALAKKYDTSVYSLGLSRIRETMKLLKIPEKEVHPNLLKEPYPSPHTKAKAEAAAAAAAQWGSIPLDAIPAKGQPGVGTGKYKRNLVPAFPVSPNHQIIMRMLDMLEKPDLPQPTADRLLSVVEKLADKIV